MSSVKKIEVSIERERQNTANVGGYFAFFNGSGHIHKRKEREEIEREEIKNIANLKYTHTHTCVCMCAVHSFI